MTNRQNTGTFSDYDVSGYKIMSTGNDKRNAIINAAMREFTKGYRKANTAVIAREANISKGLLFHYFATKKELYFFLIKYALSVILPEYEKVSLSGKDFLEALWELTMVKMELLKKQWELFDFMLSALVSMQKEFPEEAQHITDPTLELMGRIYAKTDDSLIRDDMEPDKAHKLIVWMIKGYSDEIIAEMTAKRAISMTDIEPDIQLMLNEWKGYLEMLRKAFYKSGAKI